MRRSKDRSERRRFQPPLPGPGEGVFLLYRWEVAKLVRHRTVTPAIAGSNPALPARLRSASPSFVRAGTRGVSPARLLLPKRVPFTRGLSRRSGVAAKADTPFIALCDRRQDNASPRRGARLRGDSCRSGPGRDSTAHHDRIQGLPARHLAGAREDRDPEIDAIGGMTAERGWHDAD